MDSSTRSAGHDTADRAMGTPQIISRVLSYHALSKSTLVKSALVCKRWSGLALDILWSHVTSIDPLLRLIPPAITVRDGDRVKWTVRSIVLPVHWDRFCSTPEKSCHSLKDCSLREQKTYISGSLLRELALSRPTSVLFPRLRKLTWTAEDYHVEGPWFRFATMFLHTGIAELSLVSYSRSRSMPQLLSFFKEIAIRSPNVTTLSIEVYHVAPQRNGYPDLADLLSSLHGLVNLELRGVPVPRRAIKSIGALPKLVRLVARDLYLPDPTSNRFGLRLLPGGRGGPDRENSFPSLVSISMLRGTLHAICHFLDNVSNKQNLTDLEVRLTDYSEDILSEFLHYAPATFPVLGGLLINRNDHCRDLEESFIFIIAQRPSLSMKTLDELSHFSMLKLLHIQYYHPSNMDDDYFMGLIQAMPKLSELTLRCSPVSTEHPKLTLQVLYRLSRYYLSAARVPVGLASLSIQVDATSWPDASIEDFLTVEHVQPIRTLKRLHLHTSPIGLGNSEDIVLYLSQVLPPDCKVFGSFSTRLPQISLPYGSTEENNPDHLTQKAEMDRRDREWEDVLRKLALVQRIRAADARSAARRQSQCQPLSDIIKEREED